MAVIYVGEDLDVLLELLRPDPGASAAASVTGIVDARSATKEQIGLLMTKTEGVADDEGRGKAAQGALPAHRQAGRACVWWKAWLIRIAAVAAALLVCAGLIVLHHGLQPRRRSTPP